jgi:hypothetical protein
MGCGWISSLRGYPVVMDPYVFDTLFYLISELLPAVSILLLTRRTAAVKSAHSTPGGGGGGVTSRLLPSHGTSKSSEEFHYQSLRFTNTQESQP